VILPTARPNALDLAVEADRAALRVRTETTMPAQWAITTANLCTSQGSRAVIT